MAGQKLKSARTIAIEVLNKCDPVKNYAGPFLDAVLHETDQRQRATDLVFGTLRNRRAIDAVITAFSGRPVERIQARLLNIIRIGTYELIYCPSTEPYAIVNEAVLNAKAAGGAKQVGFVNAVLRQISRHIISRGGSRTALTGRDAGCTLLADAVTGCQFDASFLPDRESCLTAENAEDAEEKIKNNSSAVSANSAVKIEKHGSAAYLSTVFSLPEWLVADWLAEYGEESAGFICLASNRRPGLYIRPNPLRTTIEALTEKIAAAEIGFEIADDSQMIRINRPRDVTQLPGFAAGEFTVQDITASKPVRMLNPQPGWTILDLCAAPGTKTTQLAEATGEKAKIIATDIDARRLEMVRENIARLGIKSVDIVPYEQVTGIAECRLPNADHSRIPHVVFYCQIENRKPKIENQFDCILLDVPCSNTGVLAKRVEARYRINPETIGQLAGIQGELLKTASGLVKPGGKICYSTCSIQKDENSEIVEKFLKENKNFTLVSQQLTLPQAEGLDHDGGYAAILAKINN